MAAIVAGTSAVHAEHFRLGMATKDDTYIVDILKLALEEADGDHTVEAVGQVILAQNRALRALAEEQPGYNLHYSGYDASREKELAMVRFPITLGMLGHRLLAVREANSKLFANTNSLEDLRKIAVLGSGIDWPDTTILKAAGLNVATATDPNLWQMLARGRFNAFPRGANEVIRQVEGARAEWPEEGIMIDRHIMLVYKFDHFFYLAKSDKAKAAIIEQGLIRAFESGKLHTLLANVPQLREIRKELQKYPRRIIYLDMPLLSESLKTLPDEYWAPFSDPH